jgi:hypothetical protein
MLIAILVGIGANALLYACKTANPLIGADAWYFVGTTVRNAAEGHLGLGDLFAKRSAFDHSQPLRKLVLLFHYRFFDLDFSIEAIVGVLAAFANLGIIWRIVRPGLHARQALVGCVFAAIAAVYLSLNASVVFDWPLLTLAFTGHAFVLCFLLACWRAFHGIDARRLALLAIAAFAMDVVVDDTGLVATIAAALAVALAASREGSWRRAWPVVLTVSATYLAYALGRHWTIDSTMASGNLARADLGTLAQALWRHLDGAQSALLAPFSSAIVHPVQLRALLGQRAQAAGVAIGLASLAAHAWFWWCAWRGRRNRAAFVATALMLLFYGLVAGILVVRVSTHALAYLWQPRYVVIYQWSILALLMMGISQLAEADEAPAVRRRMWPAAILACAAIALLALQAPLSQHSWSGVRYRNANQQRAALALGALGRRAAHRELSADVLADCRIHVQCRAEIARFLKANRLNIFSPAFQARNRLYPNARAIPRLRAERRRRGAQNLVEPVLQPHP